MEVTVKNYTYGPEYHAGQYDAYGPDGLFPAWCSDQVQWLLFFDPIDYMLVDGLDAWGADISKSLDELMSFASSMSMPSNAENSSTIQHCIWNILDGTTSCGVNYKGSPVTQHVSQLYSATRQDLLVSRPVPEPGSLVFLGTALLLAALIRMIARH